MGIQYQVVIAGNYADAARDIGKPVATSRGVSPRIVHRIGMEGTNVISLETIGTVGLVDNVPTWLDDSRAVPLTGNNASGWSTEIEFMLQERLNLPAAYLVVDETLNAVRKSLKELRGHINGVINDEMSPGDTHMHDANKVLNKLKRAGLMMIEMKRPVFEDGVWIGMEDLWSSI